MQLQYVFGNPTKKKKRGKKMARKKTRKKKSTTRKKKKSTTRRKKASASKKKATRKKASKTVRRKKKKTSTRRKKAAASTTRRKKSKKKVARKSSAKKSKSSKASSRRKKTTKRKKRRNPMKGKITVRSKTGEYVHNKTGHKKPTYATKVALKTTKFATPAEIKDMELKEAQMAKAIEMANDKLKFKGVTPATKKKIRKENAKARKELAKWRKAIASEKKITNLEMREFKDTLSKLKKMAKDGRSNVKKVSKDWDYKYKRIANPSRRKRKANAMAKKRKSKKSKRKSNPERRKNTVLGQQFFNQYAGKIGPIAGELGALGIGGLFYGSFNKVMAVYVPGVHRALNSIPVFGPVAPNLLLGIGLTVLSQRAQNRMIKNVGMTMGQGLIGSAVVGMGVNASQFLPAPINPSVPAGGGTTMPLAGINYSPGKHGQIPGSQKVDFGAVDYTPMSGVDYTPEMGSVDFTPEMGTFNTEADFGEYQQSAADFGEIPQGLG